MELKLQWVFPSHTLFQKILYLRNSPRIWQLNVQMESGNWALVLIYLPLFAHSHYHAEVFQH